jgi:UDP-N-acetylglucosamine/UDP-N-acetylgalactosamine diphosphorylase
MLNYPPELLELQRQLLHASKQPQKLSPLASPLSCGNVAAMQEGDRLLAEGKVGCLILAGGQGSRLKSSLPKALSPITPVRGKTLLELFLEKRKAASAKAGCTLPLAIMVSPATRNPIEALLRHLDEEVSIYEQESLPLVSNTGEWITASEGTLVVGPDGNGHALRLFTQCGAAANWASRGVTFVTTIPIDNPLADPYDHELIGVHARERCDVTLKAIRREHPQEMVGVIGEQNGTVTVQEYSELSEENGSLSLANINQFCFSMPFILRVAKETLPLHVARKEGVWKFERFLFDLLPYSTKTAVVVYPRENVYAPLKNATGDKSIATVQAALMRRDREVFRAITGEEPPNGPFELPQTFYYPTPELLRWEKRTELGIDYFL